MGTSQVRLADGSFVPRPTVPPFPEHYSRIPPHLLNSDGTPNYLAMILNSSVYSILPPGGTDLTRAVNLSSKLGTDIYLKREDTTPVFSFKVRGAYNLMSQLSEEEKQRGVIACSAGNHAQGVALSALKMGIAAKIVMPVATPSIKSSSVASMGAQVILEGTDFEEAKAECTRLVAEEGLTNIPPFDDPFVIAGQGTVGLEIGAQICALGGNGMQGVSAIFVPVGGGGLIAGIAAYIRSVASPSVKIIGVETWDADALNQSFSLGQRAALDEVGLFADGTAVRVIGSESWRLCAQYVDEIVCVSSDEICAAVKDVFEDTRVVPEPSGALALAGLKNYLRTNRLENSPGKYIAIVSGANINFSRLRFIADRSEVGEGKEAMLRITIPERPGSFLELHSLIYPRAVTEFIYRYSDSEKAVVFVGIQLSSPKVRGGGGSTPVMGLRERELSEIVKQIEERGMSVLDISENEFAKSHGRYLVGGRKALPSEKEKDQVKERVFRFEFPERPGALRRFLESLRQGWNISLFHYRNQGGDVGKVFAGIQVPSSDTAQFEKWLVEMEYPWVEETLNPVYCDL